MTEAAGSHLRRLSSQFVAVYTGSVNSNDGSDSQDGRAFFYFYVHVHFPHSDYTAVETVKGSVGQRLKGHWIEML
jgi:hypothetical protein